VKANVNMRPPRVCCDRTVDHLGQRLPTIWWDGTDATAPFLHTPEEVGLPLWRASRRPPLAGQPPCAVALVAGRPKLCSPQETIESKFGIRKTSILGKPSKVRKAFGTPLDKRSSSAANADGNGLYQPFSENNS
jgi:hypothetical protein